MNCIKVTSIFFLLLACFSGRAVPPAPMVTLQSNDGKEFKVDRELISKASGTIKNLLQDVAETEAPIPLPIIDGSTLEKILSYLKNPDKTIGLISQLKGEPLYNFIQAFMYLDIPIFFKKLPATIWLANLLTNMPLPLEKFNYPLNSLAISNDGSFIVTGRLTARKWTLVEPASLSSSFTLNQLILIAKIHEHFSGKILLDLSVSPTKEPAKTNIEIFKSLPKPLQNALTPYIKLP